MSDVLVLLILVAAIVAAARVLPRVGGIAPPPFRAGRIVEVALALAIAGALAHVAGASVGMSIAQGLVAPQIAALHARAIVTSPSELDELTETGAQVVLALLAAPIAAASLTRAFTERPVTVASVLGGAVAGELALTAAHLAMVRAFVGAATRSGGELQPMIDVADAVATAGRGISLFAVAGVVGGVVCVVVGKSSALGERPPSERRALLIALCLGGPAAFVFGALASPSPDLFSQILGALVIGVAWLIAVGAGFVAQRLRRASLGLASS